MASVIFSKSSDVNNSIFGKSQEPVRAVITQGVESFEAKSLLSTVYSMDTSTSFAEKYTSETSLGDFEDVGENGAYPKASMQEGFAKVIEPTTWKSSFEVTQELVEDGKFGKMKSRASIFTTSYNRTREKFGAALLAGGACFPRPTPAAPGAQSWPRQTASPGCSAWRCWTRCRRPCRALWTTTATC